MFTGIVAAVGTLLERNDRGGDCRLRIAAETLDLGDTGIGDSIAVNGCCLTVVELEADGFSADVSNETLRCTTLGSLEPGRRVNLEKAMCLGDRLGGHLVSGHVDGIGALLRRESDGDSLRLSLRAPAGLARYIARKGCICIDGASLTVNEVDGTDFSVNIIPHTRAETIIGQYREGQQVNLEVDLLARYLERLQSGSPEN
ncbi:MAG: riboflavin synthase [Gammaproteobacteria bacterium]|nr:riboflavin synthase [Gammaproteobacteria bacterium]MXX06306.1 riboflavin synthase [Gammaproteobacteria bacterium]MYE29643.1 riboflavin synthase [Gammaproteobacteria bacterium]MYI02611.1 riboflavin synthase [Gammaproteobacteria bacterium]